MRCAEYATALYRHRCIQSPLYIATDIYIAAAPRRTPPRGHRVVTVWSPRQVMRTADGYGVLEVRSGAGLNRRCSPRRRRRLTAGRERNGRCTRRAGGARGTPSEYSEHHPRGFSEGAGGTQAVLE
jgi:hypothetical protein